MDVKLAAISHWRVLRINSSRSCPVGNVSARSFNVSISVTLCLKRRRGIARAADTELIPPFSNSGTDRLLLSFLVSPLKELARSNAPVGIQFREEFGSNPELASLPWAHHGFALFAAGLARNGP